MGIVLLALLAAALIVGFGGSVTNLIPLYTVLPRQGELGDAVRHLLDDKGSESQEMMNMQDVPRARRQVEVAGPLWSSLAFLTVVLTLSCV